MRESNNKTPPGIIVLEQNDFLDFQPILANITKSTQINDNENLYFSKLYNFKLTPIIQNLFS